MVMVDCERCRAALSARRDGRGTELDDAVIRRHLGSCPTCRNHDDELARLDALARRAVDAVTGSARAGRPVVLPDLAELVGRVALGLVAVFHILRCLSELRAAVPPNGLQSTALAATGMHGAEGAIWGLSFAGLLLVAAIRPRNAPVVAVFAAVELVVMALTHHDAVHSHLGVGSPTVAAWVGSHSLDLVALVCLLAVTARMSRHSWRWLL